MQQMIDEKSQTPKVLFYVGMSEALRSPAVPTAEAGLKRRSNASIKSSKSHYHAAVEEQQGKDVFYLLLTLRFINALAVHTFFQPDEYFQSLEPAWQLAFGQGSGAWITWEWQHQLRSSLHPALFAVLYYVMDHFMTFLSMYPQFRAMILVYLPKVFQGVIAAYGDYYTWKLAERVYGRGSNASWTALLVTVFSPWQWFCSTRTLSNSLETVMTVTALYHWPWVLYEDANATAYGVVVTEKSENASENSSAFKSSSDLTDLRLCLFFAAIACLLRPTNLLIWLSIITISFTRIGVAGKTVLSFQDVLLITREAVFSGSAALLISAISDRLYFGFWTFPPYQWLNFNIKKDLAVFYGTNRVDYYVTEGLPMLLTTYLPFAVVALITSTSVSTRSVSTYVANIRFQFAFTIIVTIATLSIISHKEVRFIYPLLPLLHILLAPHISSFFTGTPPLSSSTDSTLPPKLPVSKLRKILLTLLISTNITIALYTTLVHQRGVLDVLSFLRHDYESLHLSPRGELLSSSANETFAAFLMPCHSTPWRSHLVYPSLHSWALTCEPPLDIPAGTVERANYRDEADRFYDDMASFLKREVGTRERPWPRYVVGFEGIEAPLREWYEREMGGWTTKRKWEGFNTHWHDDWRRKGKVVVWEFVEKAD